jgi:aspartyl-tRNA(Asn)/glutamyl-tRNA(Gln) amidotransferase subunit B
VVIDQELIDEIRKSLPELPTSRKDRYINVFGIPWYDAQLITQSRPLADMFETAVGVCGNPKLVSNWIMTDIMRRINEDKDFLSVSSLDGKKLGRVLICWTRAILRRIRQRNPGHSGSGGWRPGCHN